MGTVKKANTESLSLKNVAIKNRLNIVDALKKTLNTTNKYNLNITSVAQRFT